MPQTIIPLSLIHRVILMCGIHPKFLHPKRTTLLVKYTVLPICTNDIFVGELRQQVQQDDTLHPIILNNVQDSGGLRHRKNLYTI